MRKKRRKRKTPKRVLRLPDLALAKTAVLNTLTSESAQRSYDHAITEFVDWYCSEPRLAFNRVVVLRYRMHLEQLQYAASTINLRLAAVRRLAYEAADSGLLSPELAAGIRRVKGVRRLGVRIGNWLTAKQARALLESPSSETLRGKRDRAILAVMVGSAARRVARFDHGGCAATRRALGDRRSAWQGWPCSDRADASLGEVYGRRLDERQRYHNRTHLSRNPPDWPRVGHRCDSQGHLAGRQSRCSKSRYRNARTARLEAHLRQAMPPGRRRTGADPVSLGPRFGGNNRALSRFEAEAAGCG